MILPTALLMLVVHTRFVCMENKEASRSGTMVLSKSLHSRGVFALCCQRLRGKGVTSKSRTISHTANKFDYT